MLSARNRVLVRESPIRAVQELALKSPRLVSPFCSAYFEAHLLNVVCVRQPAASEALGDVLKHNQDPFCRRHSLILFERQPRSLSRRPVSAHQQCVIWVASSTWEVRFVHAANVVAELSSDWGSRNVVPPRRESTRVLCHGDGDGVPPPPFAQEAGYTPSTYSRQDPGLGTFDGRKKHVTQ